MTPRFTFAVKAALTATLIALSGTASAFSFDSCKDVTIVVRNHTGEEVRIYDLDYYDYAVGIWRSEPLNNFNLRGGKSKFIERNLGSVNQARTQIRIQYRKLDSDGEYRIKTEDWSSSGVCSKGKTFEVKLEN